MDFKKIILLITLTASSVQTVPETPHTHEQKIPTQAPEKQLPAKVEKPSLLALSCVFGGRYIQGLVYPLIRYNAPEHRSEGPASVIWPEISQEIAHCKKAYAEEKNPTDRYLTYASCAGLALGIATLTLGTGIVAIKVFKFFKNI